MNLKKYIPLSVPSLKGNELKYVKNCVDTEWVSSAGKYVVKFENEIASYTKSKYAIACVNGTAALQVSLRLAGVVKGDEVIVPTLTFIAPINAVIYNNAHPVFMDADNYYNIDVEKTIDFIENETFFKNGNSFNKRTNRRVSAIIPVHVWGNACNLEDLINICNSRNISIVEDASESLGTVYNHGKLKNSHTGSVGRLGCISFNGNKIITTGGGGMIITNDKKLAEKAAYLTTQAKNDPIRYVHDEVGYNFRLTNIQAALGVAQLENMANYLVKKNSIFNFYKDALDKIEGISIACSPRYASNNHWLNILKIEQNYPLDREKLMRRLEKSNIQSRPVWALNHLQKPFKKFQNFKIDNASSLVEESLCIPSSVNLLDEDLIRIMSVLNE